MAILLFILHLPISRLHEIGFSGRGKAALFDVVKGLYSMHEKGLIHYDLKSSNILLTKEGNAKIADFGLGRSVNDPETGTLAQGTVPYMAPEILKPCKQTPGSLASDVWSFSTMIWEVSGSSTGQDKTLDTPLLRCSRFNCLLGCPARTCKNVR